MPKRKSDVIDISSDGEQDIVAPSAPKKARSSAGDTDTTLVGSSAPKAATSKAPKASGSKTTSAAKKKEDAIAAELAAFEEEVDAGEVAIYDDCNEIRRKIRLLQKEPGFKVTHWLRDDLGGVNSNSLSRFNKATGPTGGAENGTYLAAYIYFERIRIKEGKKKTAKRERNEIEHPNGFPMEDRARRGVWVITGRR